MNKEGDIQEERNRKQEREWMMGYEVMKINVTHATLHATQTQEQAESSSKSNESEYRARRSG